MTTKYDLKLELFTAGAFDRPLITKKLNFAKILVIQTKFGLNLNYFHKKIISLFSATKIKHLF